MPRRNLHTSTAEPLLATVSSNTLTDTELVSTHFAESNAPLTVTSFMQLLVDANVYYENPAEVEHRLRQLTAQGWLYMSAFRDPKTNAFIEYRWVAN